MEKVYCIKCGVLRMDEVNARESEKECQITTEKVCPVCSCPYVKLVDVKK